jgi:hypothetical protein
MTGGSCVSGYRSARTARQSLVYGTRLCASITTLGPSGKRREMGNTSAVCRKRLDYRGPAPFFVVPVARCQQRLRGGGDGIPQNEGPDRRGQGVRTGSFFLVRVCRFWPLPSLSRRGRTMEKMCKARTTFPPKNHHPEFHHPSRSRARSCTPVPAPRRLGMADLRFVCYSPTPFGSVFDFSPGSHAI